VTGSWGKRIGSASSRSSHAAFWVVGVILIGGAWTSTASAELVKAELVKKVTDTVGSTVRAVEAGANAVPSLPSTTAPAKPPPQAAPPASGLGQAAEQGVGGQAAKQGVGGQAAEQGVNSPFNSS
jgi:hypothetical protein